MPHSAWSAGLRRAARPGGTPWPTGHEAGIDGGGVAGRVRRGKQPAGAGLRDSQGARARRDRDDSGTRLSIHSSGAGSDAAPAATRPHPRAARPRTNLPKQLPPIYGRAAEIAQITHAARPHIAWSRIVGPAGIGKTRLSQSVAFNLAGEWPDGAWIVELAGTNDAAAAHSTIAKTIGVTLDPRKPPEQALIDGLRRRWMLLVLDNCEHLLEPVAAFVRALLDRAPGIRLLITSQARLRLPDEHDGATRRPVASRER